MRTVRTARGPWTGVAALLLAVCTAARAAPVPAATATPMVATASTASASGPAAATRERFTFYGLTPAAAGQRLAQAEAALGQPLKPLPPPRGRASAPAGDCHYRGTEAQPGVRYAVAGDVVTRIETRDARYATVSGVHVGDTVARAQQAYGRRLAQTPHPYFDKGRVLTVPSPDRRFALVMESNDQGRIITLRGGRVPEVTWLEGCAS